MSESQVNFSSGLPETVLPDVAPELAEALTKALTSSDPRSSLGEVVRLDPSFSEAWARLGEHARDDIESYAYSRVGYHRGLDALRKAGWRGTGYVRWRNPSNQGFLRALEGLRRSAEAVGETEEAERCAMFLKQCDPEWNGLPSD